MKQNALIRFEASSLQGVFKIRHTVPRDERGSFGRLFCQDSFDRQGLDFTPLQVNLSTNTSLHTLRGLHYQTAPYEEAKLIHVVRGALYDVAVDLRPDSPTYRQWEGFNLRDDFKTGLFLPKGVAHGFLTLSADTHILYHIDQIYSSDHARGLRWNDPAFAIDWPAEPVVMSEKDENWPDMKPEQIRRDLCIIRFTGFDLL
jgi:dTDP-4-dehydrorhamnose 3,5-epimerase